MEDFDIETQAELPKISCVVRSRPLNENEKRRGDENILEFISNETVLVKEYK